MDICIWIYNDLSNNVIGRGRVLDILKCNIFKLLQNTFYHNNVILN